MKKIKIGIDLDNTIWELVTPWLALYNQIANDDVQLNDITEYDIDKFVKSPETLHYILEMLNFWDSVELYEDTAECIHKILNDEQFELYIVTATSYKIAADKFRRLFKLLPELNESQLIITQHKEMLDLDVLIDDYECNLVGILTKGIPILISQPYNIAFPETQYGIIRKKNLTEALQTIYNYINLNILS